MKKNFRKYNLENLEQLIKVVNKYIIDISKLEKSNQNIYTFKKQLYWPNYKG